MFHMVWWFLHLLWSHAAARRSAPPAPAPVSDESLRDCLRTTVVTGASSGLGYAIALEVLRAQASVRGALGQRFRLILVCKTAEGARAARARLLREVPRAAMAWVVPRGVDMADPDTVVAFARALAKDWESQGSGGATLLVNNAGVYCGSIRYTSPHGLEETFAANFFGHYLLTRELAEMGALSLRQAKVVFVSSFSHRAVTWPQFSQWLDRVHVADPKDRKDRTQSLYPALSYACTKLGLVVLASYLSQPEGGPTFLCLDPGAVRTRITKNWPAPLVFAYSAVLSVLHLFQDPKRVARALVERVANDNGGAQRGEGAYIFGQRGALLTPSALARQARVGSSLVARCEEIRKKLGC